MKLNGSKSPLVAATSLLCAFLFAPLCSGASGEETNLPVSVKCGNVVITFLPASTNVRPHVPEGSGQSIEKCVGYRDLPLKPGVRLVVLGFGHGPNCAVIDGRYYEFDQYERKFPDMLGSIDTEKKARAVFRILHGHSSLGDRVDRERLRSFIATNSNQFANLHIVPRQISSLDDWPKEDLAQTNSAWVLHCCLFDGLRVVDYFEAVRRDGRIGSVRRIIIDTDIPMDEEDPMSIFLMPNNEKAVREYTEKDKKARELEEFLKKELHPTLDRFQ